MMVAYGSTSQWESICLLLAAAEPLLYKKQE
jgi:hypothetical protein